jgi:hypothetical protein
MWVKLKIPWDILLHPPQNRRMGQGDATLGHHSDEIAGAELIRQIPPDTQDDDLLVKVPPFEEILCRGRFRHPSRYRKTPSVSTVCTRTPWVTWVSRLLMNFFLQSANEEQEPWKLPLPVAEC